MMKVCGSPSSSSLSPLSPKQAVSLSGTCLPIMERNAARVCAGEAKRAKAGRSSSAGGQRKASPKKSASSPSNWRSQSRRQRRVQRGGMEWM